MNNFCSSDIIKKHSNLSQFRIRNDAFWEFCFSKHIVDQHRKDNLLRIFSVFDDQERQHGKRLTFQQLNLFFQKKYGESLTNKFLRQLFSTGLLQDGLELEMFRNGGGEVFRVDERDLIHFILDDEFPCQKDIFVSSKPMINAEMARNVKLADKVFEIVPVQRKIELLQLMDEVMKSKEYREVKDKSAEASDMEPERFIGFLQLYWSDVFKITPDHETGQVWVKRHVLHHQKPSQEKKYMKEIMTSLPTFPLHSKLLTATHVVKFHTTKVPSDGIGLQLLELENDFNFIKTELRKYYSEVKGLKEKTERNSRRLHPNETYEGTCCLRLIEGEECFKRCRITGQSNGLAMVQDADYIYHGLQTIKNLYRIPSYLMGIRQSCVYGVAENLKTITENDRATWDDNCKKAIRPSMRCVAKFHRPAERIDYSGRRKHAIFMVTIQVNEMGTSKPYMLIPGTL